MNQATRGIAWFSGLFALLVILTLIFVSDAFGKTIVKKTGECTREVTVNIELFVGGPTWTDEELAAMDEDQRKNIKSLMDHYASYTDAELAAIGAEWKAEFENTWNGPTKEQVENAAEELGISEDDLSKAVKEDMKLRNEIAEKVEKFLEQYGGSPTSAKCTEINCCQIYFKMNVKVRKRGDKADPDYHQIRVQKKGYRSSVTKKDGDTKNNHKGTSGTWAYDPDNPWGASAGHECGHLMGLHDQYTDAGGTKEGHLHDVMDDSFGYPQEDALQEILKIGGAECDCCPKTTTGTYWDGYYQDYGMTSMVAGDAILTNNCPHLKAAKGKYESMLKDIALNKGLSVTVRADLNSKINTQLKKINKALEKCDPPQTATSTGIGTEGVPYAPFSYDSLNCAMFGGGTVPFPFGFPTYPLGPSFPLDPQGPAQGPAATPGNNDWSTPVVPELGGGSTPKQTPAPGSTPEGPQTPAPGTEEEPKFKLGLGYGFEPEWKPLIPFSEYEYDDNPNLPERTDEDGDDIPDQGIRTPYDGYDRPIPETTPEEKEEEVPIYVPPNLYDDQYWLVFKVEQDVVQEDGTVEKGPAEKTVLKFGFTPPDAKPGGDVPRTAEDTNAGTDTEPRFVETDENGFGQIFVDGFESGDVSRWSESRSESKRTETTYDSETGLVTGFSETTQTDSGGQKEESRTPVNVAGFTLDATPMKSRIVYLDARFLALEDNFLEDVGVDFSGLGDPDDLNDNGRPDWTEIKPEYEEEIGLEGLRLGGLLPGGPVVARPGSTDPTQPGPNTPAGGTPKTELPEEVTPYLIDWIQFGNTIGATIAYPYYQEDAILEALDDYWHQYNRYLKEKLDDPYYESSGTWNQPYDDQWAIKSVGFVDGESGAWEAAGDDLAPVIVAFIDTGLDWNHADISWDNVWVNEDEIADNGIDDDMNGYIDDTIGWDFYTNNPNPWDQDGHGTFTAGLVAAAQDNGIGIAGMNPAAKIMVLKALNDFGHTRASYVAKAIKYATDNGARIINLSIGAEHQTYLEYLAIKYAHDRGVVIIAAAGNEAIDISTYGFAPYEEVIAVGSTDFEGKRAFFSNLGTQIDVVAPGIDVLSLRARMTDFMRHLKDVEYEPGSAYVGEDNRYFRSSGTSFSAPIVTGIASLILSKNPDLTNVEVKRMILNSARDTELPGVDQFTGYGVVDAVAAINADPAFEIMADISSVSAVQDDAGAFFVDVRGTADANDFAGASVQIGMGEAPTAFKEVDTLDAPVTEGALALIDANEFRTAPVWTIRLVVTHANGRTREQWYVLQLG